MHALTVFLLATSLLLGCGLTYISLAIQADIANADVNCSTTIVRTNGALLLFSIMMTTMTLCILFFELAKHDKAAELTPLFQAIYFILLIIVSLVCAILGGLLISHSNKSDGHCKDIKAKAKIVLGLGISGIILWSVPVFLFLLKKWKDLYDDHQDPDKKAKRLNARAARIKKSTLKSKERRARKKAKQKNLTEAQNNLRKEQKTQEEARRQQEREDREERERRRVTDDDDGDDDGGDDGDDGGENFKSLTPKDLEEVEQDLRDLEESVNKEEAAATPTAKKDPKSMVMSVEEMRTDLGTKSGGGSTEAKTKTKTKAKTKAKTNAKTEAMRKHAKDAKRQLEANRRKRTGNKKGSQVRKTRSKPQSATPTPADAAKLAEKEMILQDRLELLTSNLSVDEGLEKIKKIRGKQKSEEAEKKFELGNRIGLKGECEDDEKCIFFHKNAKCINNKCVIPTPADAAKLSADEKFQERYKILKSDDISVDEDRSAELNKMLETMTENEQRLKRRDSEEKGLQRRLKQLKPGESSGSKPKRARRAKRPDENKEKQKFLKRIRTKNIKGEGDRSSDPTDGFDTPDESGDESDGFDTDESGDERSPKSG